MKLRILVLGDYKLFFLPNKLEHAGLEIEAVYETEDEIWDNEGGLLAGRPRVSDRSLRLAAEASPTQYDAIIVRDNRGSGKRKALVIDPSMRDITMIVWDVWYPGQEQPYAAMGFRHFGVRVTLGDDTTYDVLAFLTEIATKKALALGA